MAGAIALVGVVTAYLAGGPVPEGRAIAPGPGTPASAGCGRVPVPGPTADAGATGDVVETLRVGDLTRSYRLAVPTGYRATSPTPLILLFHGSGSDALQTSIYTQMPKRAARLGFVVATPDAVSEQWQVSDPDAGTADLAFVHALIASLSNRFCVDRSRVYAAGISLGSEFAAIAGCTASDRIAAIGLVAAEYLLKPCTGPIPVIAFHGTADPLVPYQAGGVGVALPGVHVVGVEQNLAGWARLDGCDPVPRIIEDAPMVVRQSWVACRGGSAVVLYTVLGGGHTWPGSPIVLPVAADGPTTEKIDATGLMLDFFGHHRWSR